MEGPPVWLLDVDGVLNAISPEPDQSVWPASAWIRTEATCAGVAWPLLVAQPVVDFVRDVHRAGRAEIRWHTTWQEDAAAVGRALHLPYFPVQPCPEFTSYQEQRVGGAEPVGERWWKVAAADRVVGQGRRLVWTDDDIDLQLGRPGCEHPIIRTLAVLAVCPRTHLGLTPRNLREIDAFLSGQAADRRRGGRGRRAAPRGSAGAGGTVARLSG